MSFSKIPHHRAFDHSKGWCHCTWQVLVRETLGSLPLEIFPHFCGGNRKNGLPFCSWYTGDILKQKIVFFWGAMRPETEMKVRNKMLEENQISLLPSGTQAPNFQRRHGFLFEEESLCLSWSWWGFCVSWSSFFPWKIMDESYPGIRRLVKNFAIVIVWAYCNLSDDPIAHMVAGEWYPKGQQKSHSVDALLRNKLWFCEVISDFAEILILIIQDKPMIFV